jgi:hypothetical protein
VWIYPVDNAGADLGVENGFGHGSVGHDTPCAPVEARLAIG